MSRQKIDASRIVFVMHEMKCKKCGESQWVWLRNQKEFDDWVCPHKCKTEEVSEESIEIEGGTEGGGYESGDKIPPIPPSYGQS